jgi:hypothetical protein
MSSHMPGTHGMPHNAHPLCSNLKTDAGCIWCCAQCDAGQHVCSGCGTPVSHLGNELTGDPHGCALVSA